MIGSYFVYILASRRNGTLYIGVTNDLARRMSEHKAKLVPGFTRKYGVDKWCILRNTPRFSKHVPVNAV
jgi:putative endonuclease